MSYDICGPVMQTGKEAKLGGRDLFSIDSQLLCEFPYLVGTRSHYKRLRH